MAQSAALFGAREKNYLGKKFYLGSYFWCKRPQLVTHCVYTVPTVTQTVFICYFSSFFNGSLFSFLVFFSSMISISELTKMPQHCTPHAIFANYCLTFSLQVRSSRRKLVCYPCHQFRNATDASSADNPGHVYLIPGMWTNLFLRKGHFQCHLENVCMDAAVRAYSAAKSGLA